jgi:hypothetical protein
MDAYLEFSSRDTIFVAAGVSVVALFQDYDNLHYAGFDFLVTLRITDCLRSALG